jgi:hypothetical protein
MGIIRRALRKFFKILAIPEATICGLGFGCEEE